MKPVLRSVIPAAVPTTVSVRFPTGAVDDTSSRTTDDAPVVLPGVNVAVTPSGKLSTDRETGTVIPPARVMLMVFCPLLPRTTVTVCVPGDS